VSSVPTHLALVPRSDAARPRVARAVVQRCIDQAVPVFLSWGEGTSATVLLVAIEDGSAISKGGTRFPLQALTSITRADGGRP
jgi:hypothetical protein